MLKHIGGRQQQQQLPPVHLRTPSGGSMTNGYALHPATPVGRRPRGLNSSLSPTHSISPAGHQSSVGTVTASNHTKTTLANSSVLLLDGSRNLDESLLVQQQQQQQPIYGASGPNGPLSSSLYMPADRSLPLGGATGQQSVPTANGTSYLSSSGGLLVNHNNNHSKNVAVNGGTHIRRGSQPSLPAAASRHQVALLGSVIGVRETLTSLGLLCLLSLLMALLGLIFLFKMSPLTDHQDPVRLQDQVRLIADVAEAANVYEVSLALGSLAVTLDVCCSLVCAGQLLLAARLVSATSGLGSSVSGSRDRIKKFLSGSAVSRICAVAGFFVSIPIFLTDIVLYTVLQFPSTPAITTSIVISIGIVLCGCAMLHNILVWQRHKRYSSCSRFPSNPALSPDLSVIHHPNHKHPLHSSNVMLMSPGQHHQMPPATLDLSVLHGGNAAINLSGSLELSTLV